VVSFEEEPEEQSGRLVATLAVGMIRSLGSLAVLVDLVVT
jgi:hypothetical protein